MLHHKAVGQVRGNVVFTGLDLESLLGPGPGLGGGFFLGRYGLGGEVFLGRLGLEGGFFLGRCGLETGGHLSLSCVRLKIRLVSDARMKPGGADYLRCGALPPPPALPPSGALALYAPLGKIDPAPKLFRLRKRLDRLAEAEGRGEDFRSGSGRCAHGWCWRW